MSKPQTNEITPATFGQSKIVFLTEGSKPVLVTNNGGRRRQRQLRGVSAADVLQWCRDNAAALLYLPSAPAVAQN